MSDEATSQSVRELAIRWFELRKEAAAAKEVLDKINDAWGAAETLLVDAMLEEGTTSIRLEGYGLFSMRTQNIFSVNAANRAKFYGYLRESGHGDLIQEHINPRTLTAFLKEHCDELQGRLAAERGLDMIEAREEAVKMLNEQGASYFKQRDVAFKKE